jgi:predicted N-acyltransferase
MAYTYQLFNSIDEVDLVDWEYVRSACSEPIFMDRRFVAAVEVSMRQSCSFQYVIVYNEKTRPVACACLSARTLDLVDIADARFASIIKRLSKTAPWLRYGKVLTCGLPISVGKNSFTLASRPDGRQLLSMFDRVITKLASEAGMHAVVYKEFGADDLEWTQPLLEFGYRRVATPPMHCFEPLFRDFQEYRAALRSHYRYKVDRSLRKLHNAGVEISVRTNPDDILNTYTPEVHGLYHQVVERSNTKLETLPIEFFHELTSRLEGQVDLVLLSKGSQVLAFGWCLEADSTYHMLFAGLNYDFNAELDLYFNLMYAWLDRALRRRVSKIEVGQTANVFKARLGCYSEPLFAFMKGLGPLRSLIVRLSADLMVARTATIPVRNVFKRNVNAVAVRGNLQPLRSPQNC